LGQGDQIAWQRWIRESEVRQEPPTSGYGQEGAHHDVPIKDLREKHRTAFLFSILFVTPNFTPMKNP